MGGPTAVVGSPFAGVPNVNTLAFGMGETRLYEGTFTTDLSGAGFLGYFDVSGAGALTQLPGSPLATPGSTDAIAISPSGGHVYALDVS